MRVGRDGGGRVGQDRRGGEGGGRSQTMINGVEVLDTSASRYVQEAMYNSEDYLNEHFGGRNFSKKVINPF